MAAASVAYALVYPELTVLLLSQYRCVTLDIGGILRLSLNDTKMRVPHESCHPSNTEFEFLMSDLVSSCKSPSYLGWSSGGVFLAVVLLIRLPHWLSGQLKGFGTEGLSQGPTRKMLGFWHALCFPLSPHSPVQRARADAEHCRSATGT